MTVIRTNNLPLAFTATTAAAIIGSFNAAAVYWFNPVNVGDQVAFQDSDGNLIWQGRCEVANQSQLFRFPAAISIAGYQIPTLTSGTFYVYRS
jgi:hypothetical protein